MARWKSIDITKQQKEEYRERGFFVLENAIPKDDLGVLRAECDDLVRAQEEQMEKAGTDTLGLSRRNGRYFVFLAFRDRPQLGEFIFSDLTASICRATIGETAMLFWEQFVVKGMDKKKAEFTWHQDSGYVDTVHQPYVNCWVPLDDVSEENGTIYLLPYDRAGTREKIEHEMITGSTDRVGYFGDDPGDPVNVPAGSIAVFSSTTFHRSGANSTDNMRRAYAMQYAVEPIFEPDGSQKGLSEVFLKDGRRVR